MAGRLDLAPGGWASPGTGKRTARPWADDGEEGPHGMVAGDASGSVFSPHKVVRLAGPIAVAPGTPPGWASGVPASPAWGARKHRREEDDAAAETQAESPGPTYFIARPDGVVLPPDENRNGNGWRRTADARPTKRIRAFAPEPEAGESPPGAAPAQPTASMALVPFARPTVASPSHLSPWADPATPRIVELADNVNVLPLTAAIGLAPSEPRHWRQMQLVVYQAPVDWSRHRPADSNGTNDGDEAADDGPSPSGSLMEF